MSDEVFCGELDKNTKKPESSFLELSDFFNIMRFVIPTELDAAYNCYYIFFWQTVKVEILKKRPLQSFYSPAEVSIF